MAAWHCNDVAHSAQVLSFTPLAHTRHHHYTHQQPQQLTKMILRPISRSLLKPSTSSPIRPFSLLNPTQRSHTNRIFDPVRFPNDLHTLTMLNATDNRTLITLWSARWCQTCQDIRPSILRMIQEEKIGEREGGLGYVEVEMDAPGIGDLPVQFRVCGERLRRSIGD